ncbi:MAG: family 43 glycosylhydrolase [Acetatifactor sp.]
MSHIWSGDKGDGTYTNPILYSDYSDPDAIRVGNDYYMISSSFSNVPGIPILHSRDLVNWKVVNYVLKKLPLEKYDRPVHGCGVWAPSIRYHEGVYYVCFPMPDDGIYMCTATDPCGDWSEPVNIRPGAGWIDPCPFWDEDGKAYLVAGVAKSRIGYKSVLHIVRMQPDGMGLFGEEIRIFDGNENDQVTIEGPKMYKRNGWYYIFAPAGGVKTGWQTVLRSRNVFGPYEYRVVMRQGDTDVNGPHQGAWVDTVTGEDWFLHFQDVYAAGRIIHLQPMTWVDDWPIIGVAKDGNDWGEPVMCYPKPNVQGVDSIQKETGLDVEPATSDDFSTHTLGLQWQWNANTGKDWYDFDAQGLVLKAIRKRTVYGDVPNLLLQKWPAPEFSCITRLDLTKLTEGDEAGVISLGMNYGVVSFEKTKDCFLIKKVRGKQQFGKILVESTSEEIGFAGSLPADMTTVYVKYLVKRNGTRDLNALEKDFPCEEVIILYSLDGVCYREVLSMESIPGRWVGVKNGVFCLSTGARSGGSVTVESVRYSRSI